MEYLLIQRKHLKIRPSRGFSLIELVLVIAIVAVIAAIAAPRYTDALARYRIDLATKRIVDDLNLAQQRARSNSSSRTITFNAASNSYQIASERDLNASGATYSLRLGDDPYGATISKLNVGTLGGTSIGSLSITFNGYGVPSTSATVTITVGSYQRRINIEGDSGAASIK